MPSTSILGPGLTTAGLLLQIGSTASPPAFATIANTSEMKMPTKSEVVDVTNFGDNWRRRIPTLLDMGKITFKIYWIPTEATYANTGNGLRWVLIHQALRTWNFAYPDGLGSVDSFPAYVTAFEITASIGKVFEANIELDNSGPPTLV